MLHRSKRYSLDHVRVWHASIESARDVATGGIWTTAEFLNILGRGARAILAPPCVYQRRRARDKRAFAELNERLAALPPPSPPEGRTWGFANGMEYDCWTAYNCEGCALAGDASVAGSSSCDIFESIHDAAGDDGTIPLEIAERMALSEHRLSLYWRCPERQEVGG